MLMILKIETKQLRANDRPKLWHKLIKMHTTTHETHCQAYQGRVGTTKRTMR